MTANGWQLVKEDHFEGTSLDLDLWLPSHPDGVPLNGEKSLTFPHLFEVSNSTLKMYVNNGEIGTDGTTGPAPNIPVDYPAAQITTWGRFDFLYGYMEIRCRFPIAPGPGLWFSFWHINNNPDASTGGAHYEIDTCEVLTGSGATPGPTVLCMNYHGDAAAIGDRSFASTIPALQDGDFHTIGCEWHTDSIRWYCDGVLQAETTGTANADLPTDYMYTLVDIKVNGVWSGTPSDNADGTTIFPTIWEIDYVRWYQQGGNLSVKGPGLGRPLTSPGVPRYPPLARLRNATARPSYYGAPGDPVTLSVEITPKFSGTWPPATQHKSWVYNNEYTGVGGNSVVWVAGVPQTITFNNTFAGVSTTKDWDRIELFCDSGAQVKIGWILGINEPIGYGGSLGNPNGIYAGAGTPYTSGTQSPPTLDTSISSSFISTSRSGTGAITSGSVTVAVTTGQVSPYTYTWTRRSGGAGLVTANSPSAASTTFSATLTDLGTFTDIFDCFVHDSTAGTNRPSPPSPPSTPYLTNARVQQTVTVQMTAVGPSEMGSRHVRNTRIARRR